VELDAALDFIRANTNLWVDVIGHTSSSGGAGANSRVGMQRAREIRNFLIAGTPGVRRIPRGEPLAGSFRFLTPINRRDTVAPGAGVDPRRVAILCARYPAGAQVLPTGTFRGLTRHTPPDNPAVQGPLQGGVGDPCAVRLVQTAWP
jgi:hypothetical protein